MLNFFRKKILNFLLGIDNSRPAYSLNKYEDNYKDEDIKMLTAEEAQALIPEAAAEELKKRQNRVFHKIRNAIKKGKTTTILHYSEINGLQTFFEGLNYVVSRIEPTPAEVRNNDNFIYDDEGIQTNIPYHYYTISWDISA